MKNKQNPCDDGLCRDGSFVVLFTTTKGALSKKTLHFLLAQREDDQLWELLGGGFDLRDYDAKTAVIREVREESGIRLKTDKAVNYFAHMTQKWNVSEKGHAFYFEKELHPRYLRKKFKVSDDHLDVRWHTLEEILRDGELYYKTATLRVILRFLHFKEKSEFQFGILKEKVKLGNYEF